MTRWPYHLLYSAVGALVFCILLGKPALAGICVGMAVGVLLSAVLGPITGSGGELFAGFWLVRYTACLIGSMLLATLRLLPIAVGRGAFPVGMVQIRPHAGERGRVLVANSITLTPGTVTLEVSAQRYTVLCANPPRGKNERDAVAAGFEARLRTGRQG